MQTLKSEKNKNKKPHLTNTSQSNKQKKKGKIQRCTKQDVRREMHVHTEDLKNMQKKISISEIK